jgi:hypothetical protein
MRRRVRHQSNTGLFFAEYSQQLQSLPSSSDQQASAAACRLQRCSTFTLLELLAQ